MTVKSSMLAFSITFALVASGYTSNAVKSEAKENAQSSNVGSTAADSGDSSTDKTSSATARTKREDRTTTVAGKRGNSRSHSRPVRKKSLRRSSSKALTRFQMKNIDFHTEDTIVYRIRSLHGVLLRSNQATPPTFDDKRSFILKVDSGIVGLRTDTLADLMNNYAFAYPNASLKDFSVSTKENQIKLEGKMHKLAWVPFEIVGDLSATPEGKIRLHPTTIKVEGIPVKGLMHVFGVELDELIKTREERGVKIDDNDIIMDPERITPPPQIQGSVTAVQIDGDEVIQVFGPVSKSYGRATTSATALHPKGAGYMYYRGGTIRFGKLTMNNADLRIVDANPKDVFDFSIDHYNRQLVAGYSKSTLRYGLVTHMPDYNKLREKHTESHLLGGRKKR